PTPVHDREEPGTARICIVAPALIVRFVDPMTSAIRGVIGWYVDWTETVTGWPISTVPGVVMVTLELVRLAGPPPRSAIVLMHEALRGSTDAKRAASCAALARAL